MISSCLKISLREYNFITNNINQKVNMIKLRSKSFISHTHTYIYLYIYIFRYAKQTDAYSKPTNKLAGSYMMGKLTLNRLICRLSTTKTKALYI